MIQRIRKSYLTKGVAVLVAMNLLVEIISPTVIYGIGGGPIDINVASFEPASTSEMVDLATGNFTYNIPLMDVDGYPINIAYHGGVGMDQDASMVGLGWTLNVGAINRTKRGLPDDFSGEDITTTVNMRPKYAVGGSVGVSAEFVGFDAFLFDKSVGIFDQVSDQSGQGNANVGANIGIGVGFDNYSGYSTEFFGGVSFGASLGPISASVGVQLNSNSQNGLTISSNHGVSLNLGPKEGGVSIGVGYGQSFNSLAGVQNKSFSSSIGMRGVSELERKGGNGGMSRSGIVPVSTVSYTPNITFETISKSRNFDFSLGLTFCYLDAEGQVKAYNSLTCLEKSSESIPAYGYLYQEIHQGSPKYLLDYNTDGEVQTNRYIANLPVTNHTYDVFSATGQGVGFGFRPHKSEVGIVSQMDREHTIKSVGVSAEAGFGLSMQFGVNVNITGGYVQSGKWEQNNLAEDDMNFNLTAPTGADDHLYERSFFKKYGNRSTIDETFYNDMGGTEAVEQKLTKSGVTHTGEEDFLDKNGNLEFTSSNNDHYKLNRDVRNTNIQYLNAEEASTYGLSESIENYSLSDYDYTSGTYTTTSTLSRYGTQSTDAKYYHLSEMTVLKGDGSRYVYGLPVLNKKTAEVTFNVSDEASDSSTPLTKDCDEGVVTYDAGTDNSTANVRGVDNLYLKRDIPAYATSHLLTAYLSSNYVDRANDGPTPDDFGGYTKFNYAKTGTTKWRFPYGTNEAYLNENVKTNDYDDMGSYVYGERDQWYLHSIETKNFVAEFHYGTRDDGYEVNGENGGRGSSNYTRKLEKIELYTREGNMNGEPPIKTVHFEYDYSLCQNNPSNINAPAGNEDGKLTLKKIYFTYGDSPRGKLHQYTFDYDTNNNPSYKLGSTDRWGAYKKIDAGTGCINTGTLNNNDFPYAEQDETTANNNANAWMLKTIHLPSGSEINVEIEADEYEYVQDKRASQMFKIKGFSKTSTFVDADKEYLYKYASGDPEQYNYLHVNVGNLGSVQSDALDNFLENYLYSDELYFKMLIDISAQSMLPWNIVSTNSYEYISGYAKVERNSCAVYDSESNGSYESVAIKLKDVAVEDDISTASGDQTNPVAKASWQFIRKYAPFVMNPIVGDIYATDNRIDCDEDEEIEQNEENNSFEVSSNVEDDRDFLNDMINMGKSHLQNMASLGGINHMLLSMQYAQKCVPTKSWVRLTNGDIAKKGGGHRVSQITVTDNWNDVKSAEQTSEYGTKYSYLTKDEEGDEISSGVASYEPIQAGGDENVMRKPLHYSIDVAMRVNDEEFQELPFGESVFASPSVVYSEVQVENIDYTDVTQNATGKTVYYHYTAKDFPIQFDFTGLASEDPKESQSDWTSMFTGENFSYLTMSQGFSIHLNDMHGKFKGKKVFGEEISSTIDPLEIYSLEHIYYTDSGDDKSLNNTVKTVDPNGVIADHLMGRDLDMVLNLNETNTFYSTFNFDAGVSVSGCFTGVTIPIPSLWLSSYSLENRFRSSSTTKVISSNGILKEVILKDKGRYKKSTNLVFDKNTGVPVITQIDHEQPTANSDYEIPIYQYDYPAYWKYSGMGLASENWGAVFVDIVNTTTFNISLGSMDDYLHPGDELAVYDLVDGDYKEKLWVIDKEDNAGYTDLFVVTASGEYPTFYEAGHSYRYKIIRSGKRNLLGSTMASVTSLDKNIVNPYTTTLTNVLNASAVEYTDTAYAYLSTKTTSSPTDYCGVYVGDKGNPYVLGLRGNWNLLASYVYDYTRNQTTGNSRVDGVFTAYTEYWKYVSGAWTVNTATEVDERWIQAAIATLFDREGYNLESKDALGIYSSILLGYNHTLKIGEAVNARYYQIGFDGFEDRDYDQTLADDCTDPHFRFVKGAEITDTEAHTGRYSCLVSPGVGVSRLSDVVNDIDHSYTAHSKPYLIKDEEVINTHTFIVDENDPTKYVLTAWVKEVDPPNGTISYDNANIDIKFNGNTLTTIEEYRSDIIDGWQRIELIFELDDMTAQANDQVEIILENDNEEAYLYYDDVRIQPFNSEMVTYVIDPVTLRLWATLDSRNFATFYQYDEEGSLVRIIQETEKGKITVQENRAGIRVQ